MKYLDDSYCSELRTVVKEVGKDYVVLADSIFHSQGGGQPADKGSINGFPVRDVQDGKHFIDVSKFKPGQEVVLRLDWSYRFKLMQAHTGEHLFYQCLNHVVPVSVEKISLTDNESSLFVKGSVSFNDLLKAEELMRSRIIESLPVTACFSSDLSGVRVKVERVSGPVRVVRVGDFDASACTGTHLRGSGEVGFFLVTGFKREGEVSRIDFMVGENAVGQALINSTNLVGLCYDLSVGVDKLLPTVKNALSERDDLRLKIKRLGSELLSLRKFVPVDGFIIEGFSCVDNSELVKLASELAKNACAVFVNDNNLIVAGVNAESVFNKIIAGLGGKGGGRPDLKIGRVDNPDIKRVRELIFS